MVTYVLRRMLLKKGVTVGDVHDLIDHKHLVRPFRDDEILKVNKAPSTWHNKCRELWEKVGITPGFKAYRTPTEAQVGARENALQRRKDRRDAKKQGRTEH